MRIKKQYTYLAQVKVKLNLTIEANLLARIKRYAAIKRMSVSELVEKHFRNLTKPSRHRNIIDLVEELEKPSLPSKGNLKKEFYEAQAKKYCF